MNGWTRIGWSAGNTAMPSIPIIPVWDITSAAVGIWKLLGAAACNVLCGDNGPCSNMKQWRTPSAQWSFKCNTQQKIIQMLFTYSLRNPGCKNVQLLGKNSWPKKLYLVVKMNYILLQMFHISQNKKYLLYGNSLRIHEVASKVHDDDTMVRYGTRWHQSYNTRTFLEKK